MRPGPRHAPSELSFPTCKTRSRAGRRPGRIQSEPCAPGWTGRELTAGRRARARSRGGPTRKRSPPGSAGSAPHAPPPAGCQHWLQARYSHASRYPPGPRGSRPASPGSPPGGTRSCSGGGFGCKSARGTARPRESRRLRPEGHREQWTVEARPQPPSLATLERPLKLCFPIGRYGVQPAAGRRLGRRHCGRCSPSTQTTQAAGLGAEFGVESLGGARGPEAENPRAGPQDCRVGQSCDLEQVITLL